MLLVAHWMRPSWPAIKSVRIQGRLVGRLARSTSQLLLTPPAEARIKASDFRMVSTDEITSRCASALCLATVVNSVVACAICFVRVSSSERMRSSIKGATRITASNASRARIPRTCLSFARLRLKLTFAIFAAHPNRQGKAKGSKTLS